MEAKRTALYPEHLARGAKMVPFAGYEMPIQYDSLKEEALSVRRDCGVFDVGHMGEFLVRGPDATAFVDHLICNDFASPDVGRALYSPLLREDGTIIDDLIAYKMGAQRILICVNAANTQKDWEWMRSKQGPFNISLEDKSISFSLLALQGPRSSAVMEKMGLLSPEDPLPFFGVAEFKWRGEDVIVARTGYTGEDGFEIFSTDSSAKSLWENLLEEGVRPCGLGARDVLRIEAGLPLYGQDLRDDLTPYDSGIGWTVKMEKQSFIGQEALRNLSPQYRSLKLTLPKGIPRHGHEIFDESGHLVGRVSSGTMSVILGKGIAMAHVKRGTVESKKFLVKIRNKYYDAFVHKGSFVPRGAKK
ncbi:MAG: glycine cleavage system aminomethyltransferase GcvT [Bacteriovoracales bacterium]|nr:glycine cleavage system aminomethyltransferase GcvT [Bacteriovoracales bacterium]